MASAQQSVTRRSLRAAERAASGNGEEPVVQQAPAELTFQPSRRDLRPPTRTLIDATVRASLRRTVARFEPQPGRHSHTAAASRHAHSAAATGPVTRAPHSASRPTSRASRRHSSPSRLWTPMLGQAPALGLALSVLMVIGAVGYVHTDNLDRADQAAVAAVAAEQSRRDRVDDATADRLNGLATAVSAERRQEALEAARAAVETADAAVVVAVQVLAADRQPAGRGGSGARRDGAAEPRPADAFRGRRQPARGYRSHGDVDGFGNGTGRRSGNGGACHGSGNGGACHGSGNGGACRGSRSHYRPPVGRGGARQDAGASGR